jgi:hypothetical protein
VIDKEKQLISLKHKKKIEQKNFGRKVAGSFLILDRENCCIEAQTLFPHRSLTE